MSDWVPRGRETFSSHPCPGNTVYRVVGVQEIIRQVGRKFIVSREVLLQTHPQGSATIIYRCRRGALLFKALDQIGRVFACRGTVKNGILTRPHRTEVWMDVWWTTKGPAAHRWDLIRQWIPLTKEKPEALKKAVRYRMARVDATVPWSYGVMRDVYQEV